MSYSIGIDIGSTTLKAVVINGNNDLVYSSYKRHNAMIKERLSACLKEISGIVGDADAHIHLTGSVGMGVAEKWHLPFIQEVVAATTYIAECCPQTSTMIDIGGEDAKVVIFNDGKAEDLRMNGNCAGGTGAFIDQMAILLGVSVDDMNTLALNAKNVYPIASRCGVFCKTDIQNLIAKNVCKEDIAASIFRAVAVQTIITLAHGYDMRPLLLFIGGPLTFIPALRKAFADYLHINDNDIIVPARSELIPAWGSALTDGGETYKLSELISEIEQCGSTARLLKDVLPPIFTDEADYAEWKERKNQSRMPRAEWKQGGQRITLGIDSGSTTTKIVALDEDNRLLYSYYHQNDGNPIQAVEKGLHELQAESERHGAQLEIAGSCSTGYGEDLIRAAFSLDCGIIETMAHYIAASDIAPDVSFILDIGGQDMKAMFIDNGTINQIEINEACSSGCGSFIGTFAKSLGYSVEDFARKACLSRQPCDLGSRCTVFMNSKVKQVIREGASVADIAAGLSYSVIKNCLYKVLKLRDTACLGKHVVVQGGTMKNDAIVRAFEELTSTNVYRSDCPELMGAIGCAIYAWKDWGRVQKAAQQETRLIASLLAGAQYTTKQQQCHGCENSCLVSRYTFAGGKRYFSGNRCERIFNNRGDKTPEGRNAYADKLRMLFDRNCDVERPAITMGIPRCLNMFEEYPFWHTLFTQCGIAVKLSSPSTFGEYEKGARKVMSDNICFPAKLVHSHIEYLKEQQVDRIFMPFVVYEPSNSKQNSFNCPIVSGYSQVIKSVEDESVPIDSPVISFKSRATLFKQCRDYLAGLGVNGAKIIRAFAKAVKSQSEYTNALVTLNEDILREGREGNVRTVMLAGRPYHADPLIQHKLSDMIASMGVNVITDDITRDYEEDVDDAHFIPQWAYPNRILKAAKWTVMQPDNVMFIEMTSFGCGPDAFLVDEVRDLLHRHGKALTLLKIDDVNNIGSLKLRVRSALDSTRLDGGGHDSGSVPFVTTPIFGKERARQKIIAPFFTSFISPLIPELMKLAGYDVDVLPISDAVSGDYGLRYTNNEVCYPATLIVGDIVKAFKEKKYDPNNTSVIMTQTGGQCRASNYISLIKKALVEAGFENVPVISLSSGSGLKNLQPGFKINLWKILPIAFTSIIYSDCIAKLYYATVARENEKGAAVRMRDKYLDMACASIRDNNPDALLKQLRLAVGDFNSICKEKNCAKVGMVGEIFLKFHPFAQRDITNWLIKRGIEVMPPMLVDFFLQVFVNNMVDSDNHISTSHIPKFVVNLFYKKVRRQINVVNEIGREFKYFVPFNSIFDEARNAERVVSLEAQFGEGWLLPAEVISCVRQGASHVVSLQPFGCIANQIVSKGVACKLKKLYPELNMLSLDFDSGVSDVNITNRMLLFLNGLL